MSHDEDNCSDLYHDHEVEDIDSEVLLIDLSVRGAQNKSPIIKDISLDDVSVHSKEDDSLGDKKFDIGETSVIQSDAVEQKTEFKSEVPINSNDEQKSNVVDNTTNIIEPTENNQFDNLHNVVESTTPVIENNENISSPHSESQDINFCTDKNVLVVKQAEDDIDSDFVPPDTSNDSAEVPSTPINPNSVFKNDNETFEKSSTNDDNKHSDEPDDSNSASAVIPSNEIDSATEVSNLECHQNENVNETEETIYSKNALSNENGSEFITCDSSVTPFGDVDSSEKHLETKSTSAIHSNNVPEVTPSFDVGLNEESATNVIEASGIRSETENTEITQSAHIAVEEVDASVDAASSSLTSNVELGDSVEQKPADIDVTEIDSSKLPMKSNNEAKLMNETPISGQNDDVMAGNLPSAQATDDHDINEKNSNDQGETEFTDIFNNGDLLKKILHPGKGSSSKPKRGSKVHVNYKLLLEDGTLVEEESDLQFVVGDSDVIDALDLVVELMQLDEECEVISKPRFAYGKVGLEGKVPANSTVQLFIRLCRIGSILEAAMLNSTELDDVVETKRQRGNYYFFREEFSKALHCYTIALKYIQNACFPVGDDKIIVVYSNMAATQLKIGALEAAIRSCDEVLRLQPNNVKALFRKGKALAEMDDLEGAISLHRQALKLDPASSALHSSLTDLKARAGKNRVQEKELYQKMIDPTGSLTKDDVKSKSVSNNIYLWALSVIVVIFAALVVYWSS